MGGKGGGQGTNTVTSTTSELPAYAQPYYTSLMERTAEQSALPYEPYGADARLADITPTQEAANEAMMQLATSGQGEGLTEAQRLAYNVGNDSFGPVNTNIYSGYEAMPLGGIGGYNPLYGSSSYNPYGYNSGYSANQQQVGFDPTQRDTGYYADNRSVGFDPISRMGGFDPYYRDANFQTSSRDSGYAGTGRDVGFDPEQRQFSGFDDMASRDSNFNAMYRNEEFEPGRLDDSQMLNSYMSPYMQQVVDVEKREASRQADIRDQEMGLNAGAAGSLGGYRDALIRSENERNLQQQTGDIQTAGQQAAFADAKQSYEQDRTARAQDEQFKQSQFGLNAEQQALMEQFGQSQFGLNAQQAVSQEQLMQSMFGMNAEQRQMAEQFGQSQFGMNDQQQQATEQFAQSQFGLNADQLAQLEQFGQSQFALNTEQQRAKEQFAQSQFGMDADQLAKLEEFSQSQFGLNEQQKQAQEQFMQSQFGQNAEQRQAHEQFMQSQFGQNEQARQMAEQFMQSGYSTEQAAMQAKEQFGQNMFQMNQSAQQFGSQQQLQQYQAYEAARQAAAQMGLTAQQANQQGQLALQQNQLGYQQNQLGAADALAGYNAQSWQDSLERIGMVSGIGQAEQQAYQQSLDMGYNDWLRQQSYPYEQLNFLSGMLQGTGMAPGSTTSIFGPQASSGQQALGAGIASLGLFQGKGGGS